MSEVMVGYCRYSSDPTAVDYHSVWNLREFPAPRLTDEETEAQRRW